jgi:hypothetical protein
VLKVVALDVEHYREIMDDMLAAEFGVDRFSSFISLQQIKHSRGFPLGLLSGPATQYDRNAYHQTRLKRLGVVAFEVVSSAVFLGGRVGRILKGCFPIWKLSQPIGVARANFLLFFQAHLEILA